jgi:hypothetical protein
VSDELVEAIRKQAGAAEGNDSFASLATWIGGQLDAANAPAAEVAQETSTGATGDRTAPPAGGSGDADPLASLKRHIGRQTDNYGQQLDGNEY